MLLSRLWNSVFTTTSGADDEDDDGDDGYYNEVQPPPPSKKSSSSRSSVEHTFLEIDSRGETRIHNVYGRTVADIHADICRVLGGTCASMDRYSSKPLSAELVMWYDHSGRDGSFNETASALVNFDVQGCAVVVSRNNETQELHNVTRDSWARDVAEFTIVPSTATPRRVERQLPRRSPQSQWPAVPYKDTSCSNTNNGQGSGLFGNSNKSNSAPSPHPLPQASPPLAFDGEGVAEEKAPRVVVLPSAPTLLQHQDGNNYVMRRVITSLIKGPKSTIGVDNDNHTLRPKTRKGDELTHNNSSGKKKKKHQQKGWIYLSDDEAQKRRRKPQLFDIEKDAGTTFVSSKDGDGKTLRTSRRLANRK